MKLEMFVINKKNLDSVQTKLLGNPNYRSNSKSSTLLIKKLVLVTKIINIPFLSDMSLYNNSSLFLIQYLSR